mmetsp:Transcript_19572/g.36402  ORF Transcript_19572/g.36402 Transcript_19572/m.36402 type:complete len:285 (-) Transcript_19572:162-1016(-)
MRVDGTQTCVQLGVRISVRGNKALVRVRAVRAIGGGLSVHKTLRIYPILCAVSPSGGLLLVRIDSAHVVNVSHGGGTGVLHGNRGGEVELVSGRVSSVGELGDLGDLEVSRLSDPERGLLASMGGNLDGGVRHGRTRNEALVDSGEAASVSPLSNPTLNGATWDEVISGKGRGSRAPAVAAPVGDKARVSVNVVVVWVVVQSTLVVGRGPTAGSIRTGSMNSHLYDRGLQEDISVRTVTYASYPALRATRTRRAGTQLRPGLNLMEQQQHCCRHPEEVQRGHSW